MHGGVNQSASNAAILGLDVDCIRSNNNVAVVAEDQVELPRISNSHAKKWLSSLRLFKRVAILKIFDRDLTERQLLVIIPLRL